ncbi:MAG: DUF1232 domain-containing protein [Candidatus Edwardsbacteria bacterium]|nr:DUF1232 domain-containing protein [Candidatus Edwardsbacteria bacterium]
MLDNKKKGPGLFGYFKGFVRMWSAFGKRDYKAFPWRTVAGAVFTAAYVVSPFDLIPDFLVPVLGFVDDAAVAGFLMTWIKKDVDKFLDWESSAGK